MTKLPPKRHATSGTRKGSGTGYGGPAKGAGDNAPRPAPFEVGNKASADRNPEVAAAKRATRDSMLMVYETICDDKDAPPMAKIMAADKWLDRKEGKAIARTVSLDPFADVTIDQLDILMAAAERADASRLIDAPSVGEEQTPGRKPN